MIALILEKGYENVTVREILDRANVGRSTFYSHYESKDQLLLAGPQNLGVRIFGDADPGTGPDAKGAPGRGEAPDFLPLFLHAADNLPLAKAMLGRKSGDVFNSHLQSHLTRAIRDRFKSRFGKAKQDKFWLRYFSGAAAGLVMGFLISWLEDDMPIPPEDMARVCGRAVAGLFKAA
ncbi:MAG TPA: TetR/AcrR family transcriptional regulator [Fibrobacteria bacterium]|nr:TetR/AcrR family transcriptional regulator [Fibrobacteria bacterium]